MSQQDTTRPAYLDGTETPAPADPSVPPGFADYAWARAQGCCEQCKGRAFTVAHIYTGKRLGRVLCERCYANLP